MLIKRVSRLTLLLLMMAEDPRELYHVPTFGKMTRSLVYRDEVLRGGRIYRKTPGDHVREAPGVEYPQWATAFRSD